MYINFRDATATAALNVKPVMAVHRHLWHVVEADLPAGVAGTPWYMQL